MAVFWFASRVESEEATDIGELQKFVQGREKLGPPPSGPEALKVSKDEQSAAAERLRAKDQR
jgi:hypothetical protein